MDDMREAASLLRRVSTTQIRGTLIAFACNGNNGKDNRNRKQNSTIRCQALFMVWDNIAELRFYDYSVSKVLHHTCLHASGGRTY